MYDDLVRDLRDETYIYHFSRDYLRNIMFEASDAIEGLSHAVEQMTEWRKNQWIPVTERLPSDFVSVQAHIVGAEPLPTVREAYVIGGKWFFPALKEFLPVDKWARFSEPPKEE